MSTLYYDWIGNKNKAPINSKQLYKSIKNYLDRTSMKSIKNINEQVFSKFKMWLLVLIFLESNLLGKDEFRILNDEIGYERANKVLKYAKSNPLENVKKKYNDALLEFKTISKSDQNEFIHRIQDMLKQYEDIYNTNKMIADLTDGV